MPSASATLGFAIGNAFVAFCATNIDDFCILIVFFARARAKMKMTNKHVCIGTFHYSM